MPLSDHEQRLLEQMERALYQEDPKFASSLRSGRGSLDRRRFATGVVVAVAGLAAVVLGVAVQQPLIGLLGFVAMVAGTYWGWQGTAQTAAGTETAAPAVSRAKPASGSGFMSKMEDRWRRRRDQGPH